MTKYYKPSLEKVKILRIEEDEDKILIKVCKDSEYGICPSCGSPSTKIHEKRSSFAQDLPSDHKKTVLEVEKRRFCCENEDCKMRIFTEELEGLRKRSHFTDAFKDFAYELAKEKGYLSAHNELQKEYKIKISLATVFYNELEKSHERRESQKLDQNQKSIILERIGEEQVFIDLNNKKPLNMKSLKGDDVKKIFLEPYKPNKKFCRENFKDAILIVDKYHTFKSLNKACMNLKERINEKISKKMDIDQPIKRFFKEIVLKRIDIDVTKRIDIDEPIKRFLDFLVDKRIDIDKPTEELLKKIYKERIDIDAPLKLLIKFLKKEIKDKEVINLDKVIMNAYESILFSFKLRKQLRELYEIKDIELAKSRLKTWIKSAERSRIREFMEVSKNFSYFFEEILNYWKMAPI